MNICIKFCPPIHPPPHMSAIVAAMDGNGKQKRNIPHDEWIIYGLPTWTWTWTLGWTKWKIFHIYLLDFNVSFFINS